MTARRSGADLFEAARLYYVEGARQSEIADRLHVSRSNVSRMLRDAREQGVIRFQLSYPAERDALWERRLLRAHKSLKAAVVVAEPPPHAKIDALDVVSEAAAEWLLEHLDDGQRVSIAWGTSVRAAVEKVCARRGCGVDVSQLGGDIDVALTRSNHDVVRELAAKLGGAYSYANVPAIVGSAEEAQEVCADVAIIGVGAVDRGSNRMLLDCTEMSRRERARGVMGGHFYDRAGQLVELPVDERIIGARTGSIANTVIIAAGAHKAEAVAGALRGRMVTTLVCDRQLARAVMNIKPS
ncbi:sugar-binding transcriptional regulator [Allokutzneria sp. NRRL B-24872]|uniref:sugar-binding transcriptional regulator n=1 Tax=Allokutzneria sp. NRRL B-24872 TaxID=1137961 RepID=UPI000A394FBD|nr:sugar-binding domain-containing protein [Allokutzneria sp. NRRL B-24872]